MTVGTAVALTSSSFRYSTPKTGKLSLSPSDFAPGSLEGATHDYLNEWDNSTLSNSDFARCFEAGIHLPNGSKFVSIKFFYVSDNTSDFLARVWRQRLATGTAALLRESHPANNAGTLTSDTKTIPSTEQSVNNGTYAYMVGVCPYSGTTFNGAIVTYKYFNAGIS